MAALVHVCVGGVAFEEALSGRGGFKQSPEEMLLFKSCELSRITNPTFKLTSRG